MKVMAEPTRQPPLPDNIKTHIKNTIQKIIHDVSSQHAMNLNRDYMNFRIDNLLNLVLRCNELFEMDQEFMVCVKNASIVFNRSCTKEAVDSSYVSPQKKLDQRGRPAFIITKDQLEFYLENNVCVRDIAKMLSVSQSTIKRRLLEFGLSVGMTYTRIDDKDLDDNVTGLVSQFPNCGYRRMYGLLMSHSIKVTEKRVRASLHRVDPEGVLLRTFQLTATQRRIYRVPGILAL
eukprot:Seg3354.3 transcript_id=Seg3354.3/GoldUCD/mRNA.D3Y31 product="hypothetical protein" protein_id=Seg3354.3/GoldUCD/D3Y31